MMLRLTRLLAMAIKELQVVLLDRRARVTLISAPIIQLALFGFATTLEVRNIDVGIVNRDAGLASERFLAALDGSPNIRSLINFHDTDALEEAIERRKVIAGLVLPPDLSNDVAAGRTGQIGLVLDGRRINSAQIVAGYLSEIAGRTGGQLRSQAAVRAPDVIAVNWFNPNLDYLWFTMPGLISLITTVVSLTVSLESIARERELGTYDELMVLPLNRLEILVGKLAPGFLVALFNVSLFILLIPLLYGVPLTGSRFLLAMATFFFALSVSGIGLSISALSQNQQQAFLAGFMVIVPMVLTSGYATPVDNMPGWLQIVSKVDPLHHMLIICQGIFLKDMPPAIVIAHIWPMALVAFVTMSIATYLFRARAD